ncbi:MAG: OmpA family protein [Sphingobacteriia bacterium]|nr:MAG: OmpA family protein [Sphingobacteriia bacterium]
MIFSYIRTSADFARLHIVIYLNQNIMKNLKLILMLTMFLSGILTVQAQTKTKSPKPGISAGVLAAGNLTWFQVKNHPTNNIRYNAGLGWAGGLWLNIPLTSKLSFEPQFQYSVLDYSGNNNPFNQFDGRLQYQSLPLLFKYKVGSDFAIIAGPQIDFTNSIQNDGPTRYFKSQYESISTILTGGFELFPRNRVQVYGRYMYGISDLKSITNPNKGFDFYNQGIQMGVKVKIYEKKKALPPPPPPAPPAPVVVPEPKDTDGDGITDENDKCPTVKGVAKYQGCPVPDTDGDGVNDENDKCITVKGLAKYQGCPIPDTDKDGVNDEEDKCPTVMGLARYQGCPIPDTDGDGVNDEEDKCPTVKGTIDNKGCPELAKQYKFDYKKVLFLTGKAILTKSSKVELEKVVKAMTEYPSLKLYVEGHSDNSGSDKINIPLSLKRANAVKTYLFTRKIAAERMLTKGFGSTMPIDSNKTPKGKANNRRVEFSVREN